MDKNILELFKNYLHSIEIKKEYGELYGDTDELINMYEKELEKNGIKLVKKKEYD